MTINGKREPVVKYSDHLEEMEHLTNVVMTEQKEKSNREMYPVFDLLENELAGGAYIGKGDNDSYRWCLFKKSGDLIAGGGTIREMLVNFIMAVC